MVGLGRYGSEDKKQMRNEEEIALEPRHLKSLGAAKIGHSALFTINESSTWDEGTSEKDEQASVIRAFRQTTAHSNRGRQTIENRRQHATQNAWASGRSGPFTLVD